MINIWWIRGTFAVYSKNYRFLFQNIQKNKGLFLRTARDIVTWCFFSFCQKPAEICKFCCKSSAFPGAFCIWQSTRKVREFLGGEKAEGQIDLHLIEFKVRDHYSDHCFCALLVRLGSSVIAGRARMKRIGNLKRIQDPKAGTFLCCLLMSSQKCSR